MNMISFFLSLFLINYLTEKNKETIKNFNMTLEISANFCFDIVQGIIKQTTYQR